MVLDCQKAKIHITPPDRILECAILPAKCPIHRDKREKRWFESNEMNSSQQRDPLYKCLLKVVSHRARLTRRGNSFPMRGCVYFRCAQKMRGDNASAKTQRTVPWNWRVWACALVWSAFFCSRRMDPWWSMRRLHFTLTSEATFTVLWKKNLCLYINGLQTFSRQGHPKILCIWPQTCILKYVVQGTPTSKELS